MEKFKKAFIKTATKYAEYVEAKIKSAVEIKVPPKADKSKQGAVYIGHAEPTVSEQLCEEIRTLNAVVTAVGKLEETMPGERDLTEAEFEEITLTPEQEEELKKKILFVISKDAETGAIEICPMNEKNRITLHGVAETEWFIKRLREARVGSSGSIRKR